MKNVVGAERKMLRIPLKSLSNKQRNGGGVEAESRNKSVGEVP